MNIKSFSKIELAVKQIETAIDIYMSGKDFFSPITLAGAGEEILGRLIEKLGRKTSLSKKTEAFIEVHKIINKKIIDEKSARDNHINKARNSLKHLNAKEDDEDDSVIMDPVFEAEAMLFRAIENYYAFTGMLTEKMLAYNNSIIRRNNIGIIREEHEIQ